MNYEELRKIQLKEKEEIGLQKLPEDFQARVRRYLEEKRKAMEEFSRKENVFSKEMVSKIRSELRNAEKILLDIYERREKKIVNQALLSVRAKVHDTLRMLPRERKLYERVIEVLRWYRENLFKEEAKPKVGIPRGKKLVRLTSSVPSFVWEEKIYGPFEKEDLVNLPAEVADLLIKERKACEVELR